MQDPRVTITVPLQRRPERRASDRFVAAMPVQVDGEEATTRDLSASGLSFESERSYEVGSRIDVVVEYILDGHHYPLRCQAEVVRVQPSGAAFTIGARLVAQQPLQDVAVGAPPMAAPPLRRIR
ncbi:MAG: hypothetical protein K0R58_3976 [Ramlibacter sp.]|jgi:hypothetical protein|nr:hypothetical protein [Ramlibacter sp.]